MSSKHLIAVISLSLFFGIAQAQYDFPFQDPDIPIEERIDNLLKQMSISEKLSWMDQNQPAISRLNLPFFTTWTEGLHGLGWANGGTVTGTQFPQAKGLANTWDPEIMEKVGYTEGVEARVYYKKYSGQRIGLVVRAPMIDLGRDLRWGRTEEGLGEDPYLTGELGKGMVRGLQGYNEKYLLTASTLKHFLANNNEAGRDNTSSDFSERLLREYYSVPFRECINKADARSFMTSYNLINGIPATVSPLVNDMVKGEWGFDGMVCTDAYAFYNLHGSQNYFDNGVISASEIVLAGTNVLVDYDKNDLSAAYTAGYITKELIDSVIRGSLRMKFQLGFFDPQDIVPYDTISGSDTPWLDQEQKELALKAGEKSIVLLKNEGNTLPLSMNSISKIALIGTYANDVYRDWYGGDAPYKVSLLKGLQDYVSGEVEITYFESSTADAATADVAIVCVGSHPTCGNYNWADCDNNYMGRETKDRVYIEMDPAQVNLVQEAYAANPNTIVVLMTGYPQAIVSIVDSVPAILHMTHSCQEQGNALAKTLFGDVNPGGKTVMTWLKSTSELPTLLDYDITNNRTYMYYEGDPLFPFGFGLSYTSFSIEDMLVSPQSPSIDDTLLVSFTITNTGTLAGDEVPQIYVTFQGTTVEMPVKQLKAFERISLEAGESKSITLQIPVKELSYWNTDLESFYVPKSSVNVQLGNSSAHIILSDTIEIAEGGKVDLLDHKEIEDEETPSSVPSIFTQNLDVRLFYQNGIQPMLRVDMPQANELIWSVYDMKGVCVKVNSENLFEGISYIDPDMTGMEKGVYLISGQTGSYSFVEKVVLR